jgi:hypothetical protein
MAKVAKAKISNAMITGTANHGRKVRRDSGSPLGCESIAILFSSDKTVRSGREATGKTQTILLEF